MDAGAPDMVQNAPNDFPLRSPIPGCGMPTPLGCAIGLAQPEYHEADVGPLPDGVLPGQTVTFEYMGLEYQTLVPEGSGPGSCFRVFIASGQDDSFEARNLKSESPHTFSDGSTCEGEVDVSSEEDPMWNTDWTVEQCLSASSHVLVDAGDNTECSADYCEDGTVEQRLDCLAFENYEEQPPECVEVFALSDVSTWFTRLQQRREQALRSGKTKLVRKIDREIDLESEKSRQKDSQAALCNGHTEEEESSEMDGIWGEDWASLPVAAVGIANA